MNKNEVISFFDKNAFVWDEHMIRDDKIIDRILANAGVCEGKDYNAFPHFAKHVTLVQQAVCP